MVIKIFGKVFNVFIPPLLNYGGVFHTPLFGLLFLIPATILWRNKQHKKAMYFYVITFGILFHIFLDYLIGGGTEAGIMLFWPLSTNSYKIHLLLMYNLNELRYALDAIILLL